MAAILQKELPIWERRGDEAILSDVLLLRAMHARGELGGAHMPEDANPGLPIGSEENYRYFTLPMALNYQRDSYKLWQAAKATAEDKETAFVFDPDFVATRTSEESLRSALLKHKLALQPVKHTDTWLRLCCAMSSLLGGELKSLFALCDNSVPALVEYVRLKNKSSFPYLSGEKICNYWLYVIDSYTDAALKDRDALNVAPDTHVIQASIRLGLISPDDAKQVETRQLVSAAWARLLKGSGIAPIDVHTPLWLWSRGGFIEIVGGRLEASRKTTAEQC
jgi:hypothetical protein